jgi:hypothetical protein
MLHLDVGALAKRPHANAYHAGGVAGRRAVWALRDNGGPAAGGRRLTGALPLNNKNLVVCVCAYQCVHNNILGRRLPCTHITGVLPPPRSLPLRPTRDGDGPFFLTAHLFSHSITHKCVSQNDYTVFPKYTAPHRIVKASHSINVPQVMKAVTGELHWGYFRDDPKAAPCMVTPLQPPLLLPPLLSALPLPLLLMDCHWQSLLLIRR